MKKQLAAWQFLAIPLFLYTTIILLPFTQSLFFSMTDWDGLSTTFNLIGFANYYRVFTDPAFSNAIFSNFLWVVVFLLVPTTLGLLLAMLLDRASAGISAFKSIIYLPMIFSYVIADDRAFIYENRDLASSIFSYARSVRISWRPPGWQSLRQPHVRYHCRGLAAYRLCMIIYLAGLKGVRSDLLEAARIDGCNSRQLYWHIVLPQLRNSTIIVVSLTVIHSLKSFDIVYIMTKGGPFRASEVLTTLMYREAFWNYRMGYGSAIANMLFFLILILIVLYLRVLKQREG